MAGRTIRFRFLGDTHDLDASIEDLDNKSEKLGGKFKETFEKDGAGGLLKMGKEAIKSHPYIAALAAASAAVGVAMIKATQATIEFAAKADEVAKKAKQIGSSAEDIQVLSGALEMGGVDASTAEAAMAKLNLRLAEAATGGGPAVAVLEKLGLAAEDLQKLPLPERFAVLADRIETLGTQGEKTAAAVKLMEEGGIRLLSAFEGGGDAIRASSEQVKAAGVISNEVAKESEFLTNAVAIAARQFTRFKDGALEPLIPVVAVVVEKVGDLFQTLSESGVLQATASAVAFVAEKFIGLTDEVERFKEETAEAAAVQADGSKKQIEFAAEVEKYTKIVADAEAEQAKLEKRIKLMPWRDHTKAIARVAEIEDKLSKSLAYNVEGDKIVGARRELKTWTELLASEEGRLASTRERGIQEAKDIAEEEERLEAERKQAAEDAKKRAKQHADHVAAHKAAMSAAVAAEIAWGDATRSAREERLTGLDAIDAAEQRAIDDVYAKEQAVVDAGHLTAKARTELAEAAEERITAIKRDHVKKRLDLIDEEVEAYGESVDAQVEDARQAALAKADAEFKYYQAVQDKSKTHYEQANEQYKADMEVVGEYTQQIAEIHNQLWDVIGNIAQQELDRWTDAYSATTGRIAEIDSELGTEISANRRRQLEAEREALVEQSEMEKEAALEAFERQKALSIVNATISTALAAINALATAPNIIVGIVLAALATAAGIASIAAIASQQPPALHSGGMVPALAPAATASDEVMIRARRGEAMLSPAGVAAAGGPQGVAAMNRGGAGGGGQTVNLIRVGPRTTEAIVHDTLRVPSSNLSRALGAIRPRVGRHDPRSRKV